LPRLAGSRQEGEAIARLGKNTGVRLFLDFQASTATMRALNWQDYAVAHFAVHTLLNADHQEFSGVVFSMFKPDGTPQNGLLRLPEIYGLRMPVDLVVLSGCRTSEGTVIPGEGLVGLSRAFLVAGARGVIGSLWSVEDQHTSQFMRLFYNNLLSLEMSTAEALRQAQLWISRTPGSRSPYYWSGFAFQGASRAN
jgi:CHAT domain-containing protein